MRQLLLLFTLISSTSALACPDLNGTYECTGSAKEEVAIQSHALNGGGRSYMMNGSFYLLADGVTAVTLEGKNSKEVRTARCVNNVLFYKTETASAGRKGRVLWQREVNLAKNKVGFDFQAILTNFDPQGRPSVDLYSYNCRLK